jgi:hypothetical protein
MDKMFDKYNRYTTRGIEREISIELQLYLWNCIDKLKEQGKELDYLQVFELTKERFDDIYFQRIEHRQEVPEYRSEYNVFPTEMVNAKIFVIDDDTHSTMLLAEEY